MCTGKWIQAAMALLVFSGAATALEPAQGTAVSEQPSLPQNVRCLKDIAYGDDVDMRMDVYLPAAASHAPVLFMVHGGAWRFGDKSIRSVIERKVSRWVSRGFILVSANYRMLPKIDPLQQSEDVARALAVAQESAPGWGGDPGKFILMGHSAGAHLVDLLSADPEIALSMGARPWLGTVSLDSAALNVVQVMAASHYRFYDRAFGKDPKYWQLTSPYHVLNSAARPLLVVCSRIRMDDPCAEARNFADKARSLNVRVEVLPQELSHLQVDEALGEEGGYTSAVEAFMASLDPVVNQLLR